MPTPLQLQIVFNPTQPRREVFTESPITFGREGDNRIVLPEAIISRRHGRIVFEGNAWVLFNDSDNGTLVNGKSVGKKGRPLANRDVVSVGDRRVFEVIFDQAGSATEAIDPLAVPDNDAPTIDPADAKKRRFRNFVIAIMGFWLFVGIFLFTLSPPADKKDGPNVTLSDRDIETEVRRAPKPVTPDQALGNDRLQDATQFYNTRTTDLANTYRAYKNYQQALAYFNKTSFEDAFAQRRYIEVQDALVESVIKYYKRGMAEFQAKQYDEAEATFSKLRRDIYPDVETKIAHNVDEQRVLIGPHLKKKRR